MTTSCSDVSVVSLSLGREHAGVEREIIVSLKHVFEAGAFIDGVYVVAFTTGLKLYRLQELPGSIVALLSDHEAYRDVELGLSAGDDLTLHARVLSSEGPA